MTEVPCKLGPPAPSLSGGSFTHSFVLSLVHSFIYSFIRLFGFLSHGSLSVSDLASHILADSLTP